VLKSFRGKFFPNSGKDATDLGTIRAGTPWLALQEAIRRSSGKEILKDALDQGLNEQDIHNVGPIYVLGLGEDMWEVEWL
jgi:hypothetical protein